MLARAVLALSLLTLPLIGCDDSTGPDDPAEAAAGTYALREVDGAELPAAFATDAQSSTSLTGGTLLLRADGSFTETLQGRRTFTVTGVTEDVQFVENGTFDIVGQLVTFSVPPSGDFEGVSWDGGIDGRVVTYTLDGHALRFER